MVNVYILFCSLVLTLSSFGQSISSYAFPAGAFIEAGACKKINSGIILCNKTSLGTSEKTHIYKLDNSGNLLWTLNDSTGTINNVVDLAEDSSHHLFFICDDTTGYDYYSLFKTTALGNLVWSIRLSKNGYSSYGSPSIVLDKLGNVYVLSCLSEATILYKINSSGGLVWSRTIIADLATSKNPCFDVLALSTNEVVVCGKAELDAYFCKISSNGDLIWSKRISDSNLSYALPTCLIELDSCGLLIAGYRGQNIAPYYNGMFLMKMDSAGQVRQYVFYCDTLQQNNFIPDKLTLLANGNVRVLGHGGYFHFAEFNSDFTLINYSYWQIANNIQSFPGGIDASNIGFTALFSDRIGLVYLFRLPSLLGSFCGLVDVLSIKSLPIAINNSIYDYDINYSNGSGILTYPLILGEATPIMLNEYCSVLTSINLNNTEDIIVKTYPNPTKVDGEVNVEVSSGKISEIRVVDLSGTVIKTTKEINHSNFTLQGLQKGLNLIIVYTNESDCVIIKQLVE